jgi:Rad3-related DNA helicase
MENVNYYKHKRLQKYLPNITDEQVKYTGLKLFRHILICGGTGSGKTLALMNYIALSSKVKDGTYKKIILCYKTDEPMYRFLKDELRNDLITFRSVGEMMDVQKFADGSADNTDKYLVIFDDCVNDKSRDELKKINDFFCFGRKKNITLMFLSQSFYQTDIFIRKQVSYVILSGIKGNRDLTSILKDYQMNDITKEQLIHMYQAASHKNDPDEVNFFKIDAGADTPITKRFSKNWLGYLNPDDFV